MVVDYVSVADSFFSIPVWLMAWNVILRQGKKLFRVPQLCYLVLKSRGVLCYMGVRKFHWEPVNGKPWCWWVCFLVLFLVCCWCSFFPFLLQFGTRVQAVNATAPGVMSTESFSREGEGWCFVYAQAAQPSYLTVLEECSNQIWENFEEVKFGFIFYYW